MLWGRRTGRIPDGRARRGVAWAVLGLVLAGAGAARGGLFAAALPSLPDPVGVAGPFAGVSGGALLVAGGANFPAGMPWEGGRKVWHDAVYALASPTGAWDRAGALPAPRAYGVSITTERGVLCVGGSDSARHHPDAFLLNWDGARLAVRRLPPLPVPLANACGAAAGAVVYVAGGETAPGAVEASSGFWSLDLDAPAAGWRPLPSWPGPARTLAAAGAQAGVFHLAGGVSLRAGPDGSPVRTYLRDAYRYEPRTGWRRLADLPHPAAAGPAPMPAVGPSHLLLLGCDDGAHYGFDPPSAHPGFNGAILAYHTITDTWTTFGTAAACRVTAPAVTWQGGIVVPSGEVRPGVRSPEIWRYAPVAQKAGFGLANYLTLFAYLGAMVWLGTSFARRNRSTDDFFRGGQRIPWWAAGVSIFATMLSSITFMAIPAKGYAEGWNLFLGNTYLLLTPLVTLVYLPFYRSLNVTSAYEYLERRFNGVVRMIASALFILFQCGRIAIVLYLPALALATVSRLDVTTSIILMGVLCVVYTMLGGIEAVIWTDFAQAIVLMGGAVWALVTIVARVDGGAPAIVAAANEGGKVLQSVPWTWDVTLASGWVIMIGSVFGNLFSYTASQDIVQRYVTTADRRGAARAIWTNAALSPVAQALFFAIGTALFAFYRQHPTRLDPTLPTDAIFPLFIVRELPAGVAGLIVAGVFAAAQSTLASSLNSVATAYITDFHRRLAPGRTDRQYLRLAQALTGVVGLGGTLAALWLARSDVRSIWEAFLNVLGLFGGTISGLFVLGIFSRRAHGRGALAGALVSGALVWHVSSHRLTVFWCFALIGVLSCVIVGWLASLVLPGPRAAPEGMTVFTRKSTHED